MKINNFEKIGNKYFQSFEKRDLKSLTEILSSECILADWDIRLHGIAPITEHLKELFVSFKKINVVLNNIFFSSKALAAEIILTFDGRNALNIVDILEIKNNEIVSISVNKR